MIDTKGIVYKDILKLLIKHKAPSVMVEEYKNAPYIAKALTQDTNAEVTAIKMFFSRILGLLNGPTLRAQYLVQADTRYKDWIMGFDKEIIPFILTAYKAQEEDI